METIAGQGRLILRVGVQHALLFQVVRNRVLRQKRRRDLNFSANPFAFGVWSVGRMIAASTAAELRAELGALNLIELLDLTPGFIAHRAGDIDLQSNPRHRQVFTTETRRTKIKGLRKIISPCLGVSVVDSAFLRRSRGWLRRAAVDHKKRQSKHDEREQ